MLYQFKTGHGLILKKVHRVIKFNQNAWLKPCIDMNADLRKKMLKMILKQIFLSWWIIQSLEKLWKNRDIKLVTTERGRNYLV